MDNWTPWQASLFILIMFVLAGPWVYAMMVAP